MFLNKLKKRIYNLEKSVADISDERPYYIKALSNNLPEIIHGSKEKFGSRTIKNIIHDLEHLQGLFEQALSGKESYYDVFIKFSFYISNLKNQQK